MQAAQAVATCVVGDSVGEAGADILNFENVGQEFAELEDAGEKSGELLAQIPVSEFFEEAGILLADHGDTGRGGDHNAFRVSIKLNESPGLRVCFTTKAGIGVHLAAASLRREEIEIDAQPLEQPHRRTSRLRKQRVVIAGDEERGAHCLQPAAFAIGMKVKNMRLRRDASMTAFTLRGDKKVGEEYE